MTDTQRHVVSTLKNIILVIETDPNSQTSMDMCSRGCFLTTEMDDWLDCLNRSGAFGKDGENDPRGLDLLGRQKYINDNEGIKAK